MLLPGEELGLIYRKTNGSCRLCGRPLSLDHYGHPNEKGGWEIVHDAPDGVEDTRYMERAYPVHVACRRDGRGPVVPRLPPEPVGSERIAGNEPSVFGALGGAIVGGVLGGAEAVMFGVSAGILAGFSVRRFLSR